MTVIAEFEKLLRQKSRPRSGTWRSVDLHNHTPASFDYRGGAADAIDQTARQILENDLSVVMFTDHSCLPEVSFVSALQDKTQRLILRGVELNVFVDAWDKPGAKVDKSLYFHLLVGFDPENASSPDYWLQDVYRKCQDETRDLGGTKVRGVSSSLDKLCEILHDSNAILIPAHLHSTRDAFKSRSVDDIYADPEFLRHARDHFTALEVTSGDTAAFFDGTHPGTGNLHKSCVQSSDSHQPSELGWRHSYVQMEELTFAELKAGLELPFRTSLQRPAEPGSYIIGIHIEGQFLRDLWLTFSPHCNVFMGVKGSGKTSVLECLRFVLGADVPTSRRDEVERHLNAILGAGGKVTALIKREDGAKILVQRSLADRAFLVTFADGRRESLQRAESLLFPTYILGWHEIEHAATDINIRRLYMDGIAGRARVRELEEQAEIIVKQIREKHDHAGSRYSLFKSLHQQVARLEELRKGLRTLEDANLIELRNQYQSATDDREALRVSVEKLRKARESAVTHTESLLTGIIFRSPTRLVEA